MSEAAQPLPENAREAIPRLLELYGGKIYGLGLRLCGSREDAQDLLQETFLQAFRKWDGFEGRAEPSTWLYTIAARACWRRHRRRAGEPRRLESLEELLPRGEGTVPDLDALGDPQERAERREIEAAVQEALIELPPAFRLPLVLKDIAELSLEEVAAVLGLEPATVKTRVHRARLKLRRLLVAGLPRRSAPSPDHSMRVCLDLLAAKQEALDRGVAFPVAPADLCARCSSLFASLDLGREACARLARAELPEPIRRAVLEHVAEPHPSSRHPAGGSP